MDATATKPESRTTFDPHALITDKVTAKLQQGQVPWHKLWGDSGQPRNLVTKEPYTGINAVLLGMEEYEHNWYLTFDEVNGLGGKVRRDVKGHTVVKWVKAERKEGQTTDTFHLKLYTVFNVAQCDKIPEQRLAVLKEKTAYPSYEFVTNSMPKPPKIVSADSNVHYDIVEDVIYMPKLRGKKKDAVYYSQLFRQLVHSTGHDSRLARKGAGAMSELAGEPQYTDEDLVADIGMCFLLSTVGVHAAIKNANGYAESWLQKLQEDKKLIIIAANRAQKAVDYILNAKANSGKVSAGNNDAS